MGSNYNIHETNDDSYYYCPNNECPCQGTTDHRTDDNHLVFYYSDNDYSWEHHLIGYKPPSNECPCNGSSTHRDDYWRTHSYGYDSLADYENAHADFKRVFPDYD